MNTDTNRYDDIIALPHHVSKKHPPLPMESRAAQFAPFAAVAGHEEAIRKVVKKHAEQRAATWAFSANDD